jgi:hypothetical protein
MKAKDALFAWTPVHWNSSRSDATRGKVRIGPLLQHGDTDWTDYPVEYSHIGGAAYTAWRTCEPAKLLAMIFIEFNAMVVRDGIDPKEVHKAFLAIDEYRDAIAPDIEGANHPGDIFGGL